MAIRRTGASTTNHQVRKELKRYRSTGTLPPSNRLLKELTR